MLNSKYWFLSLLCQCLLHGKNQVTAREFNVDMENTGVCTMSQSVVVSPFDIYNIYAEPVQDNKGIRDICTVRFTGQDGRKLKLFIRDLLFRECQIFIKMFDGQVESVSLNTPRYSFNCESGTGGTYPSYTDKVAVSLQKPDSTTTGYKFYLRLATEDGPSFGDVVPQAQTESGMTAGVIAGVVVAGVLVLVVVIAVAVYLLFAYRRKLEEKEAIAASTSILFPSGSVHADGSVHSRATSAHSSVHSSHHSMYPAFRSTTADTQTHDRDDVDTAKEKVPVKDVRREFDSMKRGMARESYRKAREEEDLRKQEELWHEHQRADRQSRLESRRGLGRTNRAPRDDMLRLTDANIRQSLRDARNKGRSFDDSLHKGSVRSTRSKHRSHHSPAHSEPAFRWGRADSEYSYSEIHSEINHRDRSRSRTRSESSRRPRASTTRSNRPQKRYNYDDRDIYSDYDDRRRDYNDRDRYHEEPNRSIRRSGTQRSRSHSPGSRRR